jgi:Cys-rich repeat protein
MGAIDTVIALVIIAAVGFVLYKFVWPLINPSSTTPCTQDSDCPSGTVCKSDICRPKGSGPGGDSVAIYEEFSNTVIGVTSENKKKGGPLNYGSSADLPYILFEWDDSTSQFYLIDKDTGDKTGLCINAAGSAKKGNHLQLIDCNTCVCPDCSDESQCDCDGKTCNKDNQYYFNESDVDNGTVIKPIISKTETDLVWQLGDDSNKEIFFREPADTRGDQFRGKQLFTFRTSQ